MPDSEDNGTMAFAATMDTRDYEAGAQKVMSWERKIGTDGEQMFNANTAAASKLGTALGTMLGTATITMFVKKLYEVRGEFQAIEVSLGTILGDKDKAAELMDTLIKTASIMPQSVKDVSRIATTLIAYGESADNVNDTILRLGDISAGLSVPLEKLARAYGSVMSMNKLTTRKMREFMNSGIPLADELAKVLGKSKEEVMQLVSSGKIGFSEVKQAIANMTNEGGKFHGLVAELSDTLPTLKSRLRDAFEEMLNSIGKDTQGLMAGTMKTLISLVEHYRVFGKVIAGLITTWGVYKTVYAAVSLFQSEAWAARMAQYKAEIAMIRQCSAELGLMGSMRAAGAGLKLLGVNPWIALAAAVAGTAVALLTFRKRQNEAALRTAELNANIGRETDAFDQLYKSATDANLPLDQRNAALKRINDKYGQYLSNMGKDLNSVTDLAAAYGDLKNAIVDANLATYQDDYTGKAAAKFKTAEQRLANAYSTIDTNNKAGLGQFDSWFQNTLLPYAKTGNWSASQAASSDLDRIRTKFMQLVGRPLEKRESDKIWEAMVNYGVSKNALDKAQKDFDNFSAGYKKNLSGTAAATVPMRTKLADVVQEIRALEEEQKSLQAKARGQGVTDAEQKRMAEISDQIEALKKEYKSLGGSDWGATATKEQKKEANAVEDIIKQTQQDLLNSGKEYAQGLISAYDDAYEQSLASAKLEYDTTKAYYDAEKQKLAEALNVGIDELKAYANGTSDAAAKKKMEQAIATAGVSSDDVVGAWNNLSSAENIAVNKYNGERSAALKSLIDSYADYATKRTAQVAKFNANMKRLREAGYSAEAAAAEKRHTKELAAQDLQYMKDNTPGLSTLFGNGADLLPDFAKMVRNATLAAQKQLDKMSLAVGVDFDEAKATALENLIKELKGLGTGGNDEAKNPFAKLKEALEVLSGKKGNGSFADTKAALDYVADAAEKACNSIKSIGSEMSSLGSELEDSGLKEIGDDLSGIGDAMSNVVSGFKSGGVWGAAAGLVLSYVQTLVKAYAESKKLDKAWHELVEDEKALARKVKDSDFQTIFGKDTYAETAAALKSAADALATYNTGLNTFNKSMTTLRNGSNSFRTYTADELVKQGGLVYAQARELIDENGMIDKEKLDLLISSKTFSTLSSNVQTYLKDLQRNVESYEDAMDIVENNLESIFGNLGSSIMDSIVSQVESGTDALTAMKKAAGDMLVTWIKNAVYSAYFADTLTNMSTKMKDAIAKGGGTNSVVDVVSDTINEIAKQLPDAEKALTESLQHLTDAGLSYSNAAASATGELQAALTEATGSEIVGIFNALNIKFTAFTAQYDAQASVAEAGWRNVVGILSETQAIRANSDAALIQLATANSHLAAIEKNTKSSYTR